MTKWLAKYRDRYETHTINISDTGKRLSASFKGLKKIEDVEDFVYQLDSVLKIAKKDRRKRRRQNK